jgi:hypothetical protein
LIRRASKVIGLLSMLSVELRDQVLSIFPLDEIFGLIRPEEPASEWNAALLGIVCRCCSWLIDADVARFICQRVMEMPAESPATVYLMVRTFVMLTNIGEIVDFLIDARRRFLESLARLAERRQQENREDQEWHFSDCPAQLLSFKDIDHSGECPGGSRSI